MRYSQKASSSAQPTSGKKLADNSFAEASYSVVSREQNLKIVGIADLDPESMRGPTRGKAFLPLALAENLHVMQPTDLREICRGLPRLWFGLVRQAHLDLYSEVERTGLPSKSRAHSSSASGS